MLSVSVAWPQVLTRCSHAKIIQEQILKLRAGDRAMVVCWSSFLFVREDEYSSTVEDFFPWSAGRFISSRGNGGKKERLKQVRMRKGEALMNAGEGTNGYVAREYDRNGETKRTWRMNRNKSNYFVKDG